MRPIGHPKTGGRAKGTPNKSSKALNDLLEVFGVEPVKFLCEVLPTLEPVKQADIYLKLLDFLYPKRKATEVSFEEETREAFKSTMENMRELIKIARSGK